MKEFVLFKDQNELPFSQATHHFKSAAGETRFFFHEINEGQLNHKIEFSAAPESVLEAVIFQNAPADSKVWIHLHAAAEKDSVLRLTVIQNGGERAQIDFHSKAVGSGARIELRGLQNAKDQQKFSIQANATHEIPHTSSDLQVWCAARGESRSVFNGIVKIEKGAHHTEAFQKNKNLILSRQATVDSFPKLFIANDNVKCAHGSSTSTLEPEQAYYLQARGIDGATAEQMLIHGFIRQAISGISDLECRNALYSKLGVQDEEWS